MGEDATTTCFPHKDALVVTLKVGNCVVKRIPMDNGNLTDIIFLNTFDAIRISPSAIQPTKATLVGFNGDHNKAREKITLPITIKGKTP